MISWNGTDTTEIAAGAHDDLIRSRAGAVTDLDTQVFIRWFWEMDGRRNTRKASSSSSYIAAWRHIVGIFQAERTDNVDWVWCPNADAFETGEAQQWYPGDAYVDWLCADGYKLRARSTRGTPKSWNGVMTFSSDCQAI